MKVNELIELLEKVDQDAEVLILSLRNWPHENVVASVMVREQMVRAAANTAEDLDEEPTRERGTAKEDVLLIEGKLRRYGFKTRPDAAH